MKHSIVEAIRSKSKTMNCGGMVPGRSEHIVEAIRKKRMAMGGMVEEGEAHELEEASMEKDALLVGDDPYDAEQARKNRIRDIFSKFSYTK